MEEDDYLLNDDEDIREDYYGPQDSDIESDEDDGDFNPESDIIEKEDSASYDGKLTKKEIWLNSAYNDIISAGKEDKENAIEDAVLTIVKANPKHTSSFTINNMVKELFHKQAHARMQNSVYVPTRPISGEDVSLDFLGEDDSGFNKLFAEEARDQIARFVDYLANRDLSKDSMLSMRQKKRHLPAFIIFLFSTGMYDLIINCPTMPKEYNEQITRALEKIMTMKYDIVRELADRYDKEGRPKVADRVRKLKLSWFLKEPAEILNAGEYSDLELTHKDVVIYREYRSRFINISKSITQDAISELIWVVRDEKAHMYEQLKDKTRGIAIAEVKEEYKNWSKKNSRSDSELATKVIWNNTEN